MNQTSETEPVTSSDLKLKFLGYLFGVPFFSIMIFVILGYWLFDTAFVLLARGINWKRNVRELKNV